MVFGGRGASQSCELLGIYNLREFSDGLCSCFSGQFKLTFRDQQGYLFLNVIGNLVYCLFGQLLQTREKQTANCSNNENDYDNIMILIETY